MNSSFVGYSQYSTCIRASSRQRVHAVSLDPSIQPCLFRRNRIVEIINNRVFASSSRVIIAIDLSSLFTWRAHISRISRFSHRRSESTGEKFVNREIASFAGLNVVTQDRRRSVLRWTMRKISFHVISHCELHA